MLYSVKFTPESQFDLQEIFDWYELQSIGLGDKFLDCVKDVSKKLSNTPGIGSLRFDDVHCTMIKKFPYFIFYTFNEKDKLVIIYRVFHTSRKPLWEK